MNLRYKKKAIEMKVKQFNNKYIFINNRIKNKININNIMFILFYKIL